MPDDATESSFKVEVELLLSMYPGEVSWDERSSELTYNHNESGLLVLRLSNRYPASSLPDVVTAQCEDGSDLRWKARNSIAKQQLGEPCLDAIIVDFIEVATQQRRDNAADQREHKEESSRGPDPSSSSKTVVIWTHHLLATSKRKLALSPSEIDADVISGITKPGYPGVMIFSGPAFAIEEHVKELKQQRWQAFQIRCELDQEWTFEHGTGMVEVEMMGEVVADIEHNAEQRRIFMDVMKIGRND